MEQDCIGYVLDRGHFVRCQFSRDNTMLEPVGCSAWARVGGRVVCGKGRGLDGEAALYVAACEIAAKLRAFDDRGSRVPF